MFFVGIVIILFILTIPKYVYADEINFKCSYHTKLKRELLLFSDCGVIESNGQISVQKKHIDNIYFGGRYELACINIHRKGWYYANEEGKIISAMEQDNGCDYFQDGVARTLIKGKVAFFNEQLEVVIATEFETATPFVNGYSAVCNGGYTEKLGIHTFKRGGDCGYINKKGELVLPLKYTLENLPSLGETIIK
jgi:hypothetical protein